MDISYTDLSDDALNNLITEFVSGTDDSGFDIPLEAKYKQVRSQLEDGSAVITFDTDSETCFIRVNEAI